MVFTWYLFGILAMNNTKHEFAFFAPKLNTLRLKIKTPATIALRDPELIKRISSIVRLTIGDICILFNAAVHTRAQITAMHKKEISVRIQKVEQNTTYAPSITCLLPLLKKDDLVSAITNLTACGVQTIQLVTTQKTQRRWGGIAELERIQRIVVAASEQSKHFSLPTVHAPISLSDALQNTHNSTNIFFDPAGKPLIDIMTLLHKDKHNSSLVSLLVGPEGDVTPEEKQLILKHTFILCSLTPTILRAHLAITLGAGIVRSILKN